MEKQHIMLDIETLGTNSRSSILSIGAVEFDIVTGETGRRFYKTIDLQSNLDAGLEMNADTVIWWMGRSDEARREVTNEYGKQSLRDVLVLLTEFLGDERDSKFIWGNSARFDCGILQDAYSALKMELPWNFRNERCVRTLVSFAPEIKDSLEFEGTPHNPVHDCLHQIKYCSEIWKTLKLN